MHRPVDYKEGFEVRQPEKPALKLIKGAEAKSAQAQLSPSELALFEALAATPERTAENLGDNVVRLRTRMEDLLGSDEKVEEKMAWRRSPITVSG